MSDTRSEQWQWLVDYSALMLEKAEAGEWEALPPMAVERQSGFEAFFAEPVPAEMAESVAAGIRHIGEIDATITGFSEQARTATSHEVELLKKRKQASQAYSDPHHNER